ncbi:hypothetical protein KPH14_008883 [Odynerus spinipes]|uniref:Uncharacterized protein n=1 Tax=Odynerus spinipes TaxID=1348599 RepID=A0AAD9VLE7_9HYME|nr:hypothetical protein KPH14_008883 [Odynerus spinipes]
MRGDESVNEYIARARNIASRSAALGHPIPDRELVFHIVRGIHPKLEKVNVAEDNRSLDTEAIVSKLNENGHRVILEDKQARIISREGSVIAEAYEESGIFIVKTNIVENTFLTSGVKQNTFIKQDAQNLKGGMTCSQML